PEFRGALAHAMRLVFLLTIPSAIGLSILAEPIIALIYEHGRFTAFSTAQTAAALRFYAFGLIGYSAVKVLAPAFYALDKRNLPMFVSLFSIALNFCLNWIFTLHLGFGHRGLALSTSVVAVTNFILLYVMMRRYAGRLETGTLFSTMAKLLMAGAVLGVVCWLGNRFFFGGGMRASLVQKIVGVMTTVAAGGLAFFAAAYALRVAELQDLVQVVRRRIAR
ncbi:MAG: murein biosynthesis integral membrane protein MurJ, partial [Chthoniobacterales bacterium]